MSPRSDTRTEADSHVMATDGIHLTLIDDPSLPVDRLMFEGIDTDVEMVGRARGGPRWSVGSMAYFFFRRSANWIRLHERGMPGQGTNLVLDGEPVVPSRKKTNARFYTLSDVEVLAHALASRGIIDAWQLRHALSLLRTLGQLWGYLPGGDTQIKRLSDGHVLFDTGVAELALLPEEAVQVGLALIQAAGPEASQSDRVVLVPGGETEG